MHSLEDKVSLNAISDRPGHAGATTHPWSVSHGSGVAKGSTLCCFHKWKLASLSGVRVGWRGANEIQFTGRSARSISQSKWQAKWNGKQCGQYFTGMCSKGERPETSHEENSACRACQRAITPQVRIPNICA